MHHDPAKPWAVFVCILTIVTFTGIIAFAAGNARGYRDAIEQGYCRP